MSDKDHEDLSGPIVSQPQHLLPVESTTFSFSLPDGDTPDAIRERVKILKGVTERCYMRLAHELWKCYHRQLYIGFGYNTFDDYVVGEVGISRDRAHKLRRIYAVLHLKCGISTQEIEEAERCRVELILGVVDRSNAREWLKRAKSLPYKSLQNQLALVRNRQAGTPSDGSASDPVFPDPSVPIRVVCESPRGNTESPTTGFVKRTFRLPQDGDSLLGEALAVAQRFTKSHSDTFNLLCIVQQFLAHNLTLDGKKDPRKDYWLRWMEEIYGGRFVHITSDEGWDALRSAIENPDNVDILISGRREGTNGQHFDDGSSERSEGDGLGGRQEESQATDEF